MKPYLFVTGLSFMLLFTSCNRAEKKAGLDKSPQAVLKTRWTDQVDPDHVFPEYPRPIQQRKAWMNLNGYWQVDTSVKGYHKLSLHFFQAGGGSGLNLKIIGPDGRDLPKENYVHK